MGGLARSRVVFLGGPDAQGFVRVSISDDRVSVNGRVLLFTLGVCVVTGLVFGMIPAYRASKNDANQCLREGGRSTATRSRHRTRNIMVVAEIAVALVSLICAGLMINTVTRILRTSPGFNPDHLLAAEVRLTGEKYMDATAKDKTGLNVISRVWEFSAGRCWNALENIRRRKCRLGRLASIL